MNLGDDTNRTKSLTHSGLTNYSVAEMYLNGKVITKFLVYMRLCQDKNVIIPLMILLPLIY